MAFVVLLPESLSFIRRRGLSVRDHVSAWTAHLRNGVFDLLFLTGFLDKAQIGLIFFAYIFGVVASPLAGTWMGRIGLGPMLVIGAATGAAGLR